MTDTRTTIDLLASLVAFDTTSRNSNLPLLDFVEAYLDRFAIPHRRVMDETGTKANLWATIGPQDVPGYILSGHTDVVPVDGQDWSSDPFILRESGDRLYGRGTTDMKGFLAAVLAMVPAMAAAGLKTPIHLAFSHDEEIGCVGVRSLCHDLARQSVKPLGCFVGEPTSMGVVIGHKGSLRQIVRLKGFAAHSSLAPRGVNTVEWGARLVARIRDLAEDLEANGARDALYDVPHTTAHVGIFRGGTAMNIVPDEAMFHFELRGIPADDLAALSAIIERHARDELVPRMKRNCADAAISFEVVNEVPALDCAADAVIATLAKRFSGHNAHSKVGYGTEAGLFQTISGIESVVVGPGDIDQAHKPDEFIAIAELDRCRDFLAQLIAHCAR